MRAPRLPQQQTEGQKRTEAYKAAWEKNRTIQKNRTAAKSLRRIRGQDLALALERAGDATGDPQFGAALEAVKIYGFEREFQRTVVREQIKKFGDTNSSYLVQVDFLHRYGKLENRKRRRQLSVLEACECVVAECGLGSSFETEVERLR